MANKIIVLTAPSGAGKSSLLKEIIKRNKDLRISISCTTRPKRETEINGVDYHFLTKQEFLSEVEQDNFIEYAEVFGNLYGTHKDYLNDDLKTHSVILEIDWQGAYAIKKLYKDTISIFILPPSMAELKKRLEERQTDTQEEIAKRFQQAKDDIKHAKKFDYQIINADFNLAVKEIEASILSEVS